MRGNAVLSTILILLATATPGLADEFQEAVDLLNQGWGDRAEAMLEELADQDPDRAEIWYQLAWARFHVEDFDEAEKRIDEAIEREPDNPDFLVLQGHIVGRRAETGSKLKSMGRGKKCRKCYERAIEVDPGHIEAYHSLIQFHLQAPGIVGGDKQKTPALAAAMAAVDSVQGLLMVAMVAEQAQEDPQAAEAALRQAMEVSTRLDPADFRAIGDFAGFCYRHDRQAEAEDLLLAAADNPALATEARAGLARVYQGQQKWDEAEKVLRELADAGDTRDRGLMGLGYLAQARERWSKAAGHFDAVIAADPTRGDALYQANKSRLLGQDFEGAAAGFQQYVESEINLWWPSRAWGYARLAEALWGTGDQSDARKAWDEAEDRKGHDGGLKNKLKELEKAWKDPWDD